MEFLGCNEEVTKAQGIAARLDEKVYVYVLGNLEREKCHTYWWNE